MTEQPFAPVGILVGGQRINLGQLTQELADGGVDVARGLGLISPPSDELPPLPPVPEPYPALPAGSRVYGYDAQMQPADLPSEAEPIVQAHVPA